MLSTLAPDINSVGLFQPTVDVVVSAASAPPLLTDNGIFDNFTAQLAPTLPPLPLPSIPAPSAAPLDLIDEFDDVVETGQSYWKEILGTLAGAGAYFGTQEGLNKAGIGLGVGAAIGLGAWGIGKAASEISRPGPRESKSDKFLSGKS